MSLTPSIDDWLDNLEVSHGRMLMLLWINSDHIECPPRLVIEEYDTPEAFDNVEPGGNVWLYPEDIPRVIAWLERWLQLLQECAKSDKEKLPAPFWGDLGGPGQTPKTDAHGDV